MIAKRFLFVSGILVSQLGFAAENSSAWEIDTRLVPAPAGASEILRNSIAGTPQPSVADSSSSPDTDEGWLALIESATIPIPLGLLEQAMGVTINRTEMAGVGVYEVTPSAIAAEHEQDVFLYLHGGAYVFNAGDNAVSEAALIASMAGMRAIAVDYRMPPADPFPAAVDDAVSVYSQLLESYQPGNIAIGGSSAGAGLSMATLHKLKQLGEPLPGLLYAGSPWSDLTKTGDSLYTNEGLDRILVTYDGYLKGAAELYASGQSLTDPLLSPIYGDFEGFPPTILVSGTRDLFLSDTVRTHRKLRAAGVRADLHIYEAMSHTGYGFMYQAQAPEALDFYRELMDFINEHL